MPERFGEEDVIWDWDGEATLVCASVRARGEPTLADVWYWEVPPLGLAVCLDVTELIRRTAVGEAGLCVEYGDAARCTGNVVDEYALEVRGRDSVTDGEPYPLPKEVLSDPLEGDTPVLTTYEGDCALDGTELTRLMARLAAIFTDGCLWRKKIGLLSSGSWPSN